MAKKKDPRLERAGVSGYNKPKATPSHATKSHVVVAKEGDKIKTIRFGQKGVKGSPDGSARNKAFKARHAKNIKKGPDECSLLGKQGEVVMAKGLWTNIHAKRKRIASGSGEKMRQPGSKGAPTAKALKDSKKKKKKK